MAIRKNRKRKEEKMEYFDKELDSIVKLKIKTFSEKDYDFIYVMTDLHGSYNAFEKFYSKISKEHDKNEKILFIITGDSCDRGPDSKKLYDIYNEINKKENKKVIHHLTSINVRISKRRCTHILCGCGYKNYLMPVNLNS